MQMEILADEVFHKFSTKRGEGAEQYTNKI